MGEQNRLRLFPVDPSIISGIGSVSAYPCRVSVSVRPSMEVWRGGSPGATWMGSTVNAAGVSHTIYWKEISYTGTSGAMRLIMESRSVFPAPTEKAVRTSVN